MMKTRFIFPILALFLYLAACTPSSPTPTRIPDSPALEEREATSTHVTPDLVKETIQTETATIVVPTATTAAPTPTEPEPVPAADLPALIVAATDPEVLLTSESPDGQWRADIVRYECVQVDSTAPDGNALEQVLITRLDDGAQTVVAEQLLYCGGLGAFGFNVRYWSSNGRYFYFDEAREGVPDGCCCGLWNPGFSRVDVETVLVERLPGDGTAVNEDGIMVGWDEENIVVWDLDEGELGRTPFAVNGFILQSLQMSPNGDRAVYVLNQNCYNTSGRSVVVLFSLADRTQTVLVDSDGPGFAYAVWDSSSRLVMLDIEGNQWLYDLDANELIPVTPVAP